MSRRCVFDTPSDSFALSNSLTSSAAVHDFSLAFQMRDVMRDGVSYSLAIGLQNFFPITEQPCFTSTEQFSFGSITSTFDLLSIIESQRLRPAFKVLLLASAPWFRQSDTKILLPVDFGRSPSHFGSSHTPGTIFGWTDLTRRSR